MNNIAPTPGACRQFPSCQLAERGTNPPSYLGPRATRENQSCHWRRPDTEIRSPEASRSFPRPDKRTRRQTSSTTKVKPPEESPPSSPQATLPSWACCREGGTAVECQVAS